MARSAVVVLSYQAHAETFFAELYEKDVCGSTPETGSGPAGNTMLAYNYPADESVPGFTGTGAGAGLKAAKAAAPTPTPAKRSPIRGPAWRN